MQKKIIALAIASALTVPALAMADTSNVTVFGQANVSYDFTDTGDYGATQGTTVNKVSTNASRFGLKGSEDLGDGLSAIWQIEQAISADVGGDALAGRDTFAGLSSKTAGTVRLGNFDDAYKKSDRGLDVFGDSIADNRSLLGGVTGKSIDSSFVGRQNNIIQYTSPDLNGFKVDIGYANLAETNTLSTNTKLDMLTLAGVYNVAPFYGSLAYEKREITNTNDDRATKLGLGYSQDAFTVNFVYERLKNDTGGAVATNYDHNTYYLAGKYSFGSDAVKAAYTKAKSMDGTPNTGAKQWSLGYDHSMSKRTSLYAVYTKLDNDTGINYGLGHQGANQNSVTAAGNGTDPSAFSFGMKHSF
jgi:predicted porin